jgi:hypothetical protein
MCNDKVEPAEGVTTPHCTSKREGSRLLRSCDESSRSRPGGEDHSPTAGRQRRVGKAWMGGAIAARTQRSCSSGRGGRGKEDTRKWSATGDEESRTIRRNVCNLHALRARPILTHPENRLLITMLPQLAEIRLTPIQPYLGELLHQGSQFQLGRVQETEDHVVASGGIFGGHLCGEKLGGGLELGEKREWTEGQQKWRKEISTTPS